MKNKLLTAFLLLISLSNLYAQQNKVKYLDNHYKEIDKEKAKYSETIYTNPDSSVTTEFRNIKKNTITSSLTFKGKEPFGIWRYEYGKELIEIDYNFTYTYFDTICRAPDFPDVGIQDLFEDNDSLKYKSPKILSGEATIFEFISNKIIYPLPAKESGIMGKVYVTFTITNTGKVDNISVKKGVNYLLDKEAVRVIRMLRFSPLTLSGIPQGFCLTIPIVFSIQ